MKRLAVFQNPMKGHKCKKKTTKNKQTKNRQQMDQKIRKLMTVHRINFLVLVSKRWHKLYLSRKEGWIEFVSIEGSLDESIWRLEYLMRKSKERLITATSNSSDRTSRTKITWKQKGNEKQLYRYFKRWSGKISYEKTWVLLRKGNFMWETVSLHKTTP